jgi:4-hydroxythreonine-4-phosphate dehydrogenase
MNRPILALTCGEPAGIGPEISCVPPGSCAMKRAASCWAMPPAGPDGHDIDPQMRVAALSIQAWRNSGLPHFPVDCLTVIDCPVAEPVRAGVLDARNGRAVLQTLDLAVQGARRVRRHGHRARCKRAPSTMPASPSPATPNTWPKTGTPQVVMMLAGGDAPPCAWRWPPRTCR